MLDGFERALLKANPPVVQAPMIAARLAAMGVFTNFCWMVMLWPYWMGGTKH